MGERGKPPFDQNPVESTDPEGDLVVQQLSYLAGAAGMLAAIWGAFTFGQAVTKDYPETVTVTDDHFRQSVITGDQAQKNDETASGVLAGFGALTFVLGAVLYRVSLSDF